MSGILRQFKGLIWLIVFPALPLFGQMVPVAPVEDFRMPMFGENGYKVWDLQGKEGHYVSADEIKVGGMFLQTFKGDEALSVETTIESSEATVFVKEHYAKGDQDILITGTNYIIEGFEWLWNGKNHNVDIGYNVRVTFLGHLALLE